MHYSSIIEYWKLDLGIITTGRISRLVLIPFTPKHSLLASTLNIFPSAGPVEAIHQSEPTPLYIPLLYSLDNHPSSVSCVYPIVVQLVIFISYNLELILDVAL